MPMGPNTLLTVRGRTSGVPRGAPVAIMASAVNATSSARTVMSNGCATCARPARGSIRGRPGRGRDGQGTAGRRGGRVLPRDAARLCRPRFPGSGGPSHDCSSGSSGRRSSTTRSARPDAAGLRADVERWLKPKSGLPSDGRVISRSCRLGSCRLRLAIHRGVEPGEQWLRLQPDQDLACRFRRGTDLGLGGVEECRHADRAQRLIEDEVQVPPAAERVAKEADGLGRTTLAGGKPCPDRDSARLDGWRGPRTGSRRPGVRRLERRLAWERWVQKPSALRRAPARRASRIRRRTSHRRHSRQRIPGRRPRAAFRTPCRTSGRPRSPRRRSSSSPRPRRHNHEGWSVLDARPEGQPKAAPRIRHGRSRATRSTRRPARPRRRSARHRTNRSDSARRARRVVRRPAGQGRPQT